MFLSWRKMFANIDGRGVVLDKVEDISHSKRKVFECVEGNNYFVAERGGES